MEKITLNWKELEQIASRALYSFKKLGESNDELQEKCRELIHMAFSAHDMFEISGLD